MSILCIFLALISGVWDWCSEKGQSHLNTCNSQLKQQACLHGCEVAVCGSRDEVYRFIIYFVHTYMPLVVYC